jgi:hypothetical protein
MPPDNLQSLQTAIRAQHGCDSQHVESVPVHEVFHGQTAWRGTVEVFEIIGHPRAKHVYSWAYEDDDGRTKTITVLEIPPVDSAQTAVKVAIAAKAQGER